ncbi:glucose-1-phosphate adenylyltransferase [Candidatus Fermentibacteria bacterium]|nr:glucose-1-phosphate adenylyltransferase [Candidatus Fermentibacteria bacterium]
MRRSTLVAVLGGGRGTRLYPLTKYRCKPAVPLGGKYRLIDIPLSNCINSGLREVYVLTQFNSVSLARHVSRTYKFDAFGRGFVDILAAEQTISHDDWFQGTADAVRKNLTRFLSGKHQDILILAADHLYRMDFREMLDTHVSSGADVTLSVIPVSPVDANRFGLMRVAPDGRVIQFVEKPPDPDALEGFAIGRGEQRTFLASMGIYAFRLSVLRELLEGREEEDFGRQVIPMAMNTHRVVAHTFQGYWEDIGTMESFHRANLSLAELDPHFRLYSESNPLFSRPRFLPATVIDGCLIRQSLIADGCIILAKRIEDSVIGIRSKIGIGTVIENSYVMGADFFELREPDGPPIDGHVPRLGIGDHCHIKNAIIDKNARIGEGCRIVNERGAQDFEGAGFSIREGLVVIEKNAVLPSGAVI